MPEHDVDKRGAPRFNARVRVLYFSKGHPRAVDAECQNISAEGLFVKTHVHIVRDAIERPCA